jgi:sarcosine oxidase
MINTVVVGLGAVGSAAMYQLARRGVEVVGLDRFSPPHDRGSSHGETRITREALGEGFVYTPYARRSHAIWRELEVETGRELLLTCGFVAIDGSGGGEFHGRQDFFGATVAAAERFGVPHERLSAEAARERFPQFALTGRERVYFEPGGGLVFPERCIAAQLERAKALGAEIRTGETVLALEPDGAGVRVVTDRTSYRARRAVLASGSWTPGFPEAARGEFRLLRQVLHWFETEDDRAYAPERFPTFIWIHGPTAEDGFYGFPAVPGLTPGVKAAMEQWSDSLASPEHLVREVAEDEARRLYDRHVSGRLQGLGRRAHRSEACVYTMTPDQDFVIDYGATSDRVLVVSACSGHGFKHSAAIGAEVADVLSRGAPPPPFGWSRASRSMEAS